VMVMAICGCESPRLSDGVPDVARGFKPHVQQVLDNIALFTADPGAWPSHILVYKGEFENRRQWTGAIGTSTKLESTNYANTMWQLVSLQDPGDIRRVRLLYQWQVGHIDFDELTRGWSEIRDRQALDGNGKPVVGGDGQPEFRAWPLPVTRDTKRDWITDDKSKSPSGMSGHSGPAAAPGTTTVWVADTEGAAQFSLAILAAMPNSH
jgi:hypothetical protein